MLGVCGCQAPRRAGGEATPLAEPSAPATAPAAGVPPAASPKPGPGVALLNPSQTSPDLANPWVPLARWAQTKNLPAPERRIDGAVTSYHWRTTNGTLALTLGSRAFHWNGVECWLGFAPQAIDGQPCLRSLDAEKNLLPLLTGGARSLGAGRTIVLDPGHGGEDAGTRSVSSQRFEKDFTLDWARRLQGLLVTNGWTVHLTRTNDTDRTLADRVAFAQDHHADLFLSLHFNSAAPRHDQSGLETYCLTPAGLPSTLTRDFPDDATQVFPNNEFDAQNLQFASRLHRALIETTGATDRGLRHARFMGVLRGQQRPAVLIEGGYLSNPREADLIATPAYRQKLARAVALAVGETVGARPLASGAPDAKLAAGPK